MSRSRIQLTISSRRRTRYAGNPNNNNGWIEADVPLLGELGVVADEPMGFDKEEVWEVNEDWLMAPVTPPPIPTVPPPSVYEVGGPSTTAAEGQVSDVEVAAGISIREISPKVFAVEGQVQVMASQMVHAADSCAAERYTDSVAADYGFGDEQPIVEHAVKEVHFGGWIGGFDAWRESPRTS
ncbi:hypothetical protein Tco_0308580 [Tanacetum coccineum]